MHGSDQIGGAGGVCVGRIDIRGQAVEAVTLLKAPDRTAYILVLSDELDILEASDEEVRPRDAKWLDIQLEGLGVDTLPAPEVLTGEPFDGWRRWVIKNKPRS